MINPATLTAKEYAERKEILDRHRRLDGSYNLEQVAKEIGKGRSSAQNLLRTVQRYEAINDPAIIGAQEAVGTNLRPSLVWAKTKNDDGTSYSVLLKPDPLGDDFMDRLQESVNGIEPIAPIEAPAQVDFDLLTIYPIADAHIGMMAWGKETGEDYDTAIACKRITDWVGRCVARSPASETAIILDVGDLTHADDYKNMTPRSGHILDVDTRHFRTLEMTISALGTAIELALAKHSKVIVRILPGNHNPTAYLAILFALAERYRNNPRVEIQKVPGEFFAFRFGENLIAAHHGDKAKATQMVMYLADTHARDWGMTKHRFLFTGHLHHHKSQDIGGVKWEQLRAVSPKDAYANSHAYSARSQLQAITYHKVSGEYERVYVGQ